MVGLAHKTNAFPARAQRRRAAARRHRARDRRTPIRRSRGRAHASLDGENGNAIMMLLAEIAKDPRAGCGRRARHAYIALRRPSGSHRRWTHRPRAARRCRAHEDQGDCAVHEQAEKHDPWKTRSAAVGAIAIALALAALAARTGERESARAARPESADEKRWQRLAPGRVEPVSERSRSQPRSWGDRAGAGQVNDKVFAGEPLIGSWTARRGAACRRRGANRLSRAARAQRGGRAGATGAADAGGTAAPG